MVVYGFGVGVINLSVVHHRLPFLPFHAECFCIIHILWHVKVSTKNTDFDVLSDVYVCDFQALFSYVVECGYSTEQYELVTTFPRRNISQLDPMCTLHDCSLYPQDTVFVQERSV